jgi:hypothetical protein
MKVFAAFALCAVAAAAPAPHISLDLSASSSFYKLVNPIYRAHDLQYTTPEKKSVLSRQSAAMKCDANVAANTQCITNKALSKAEYAANEKVCKCMIPFARAFDHVDQSVSVTRRVLMIADSVGRAVPKAQQDVTKTGINMKTRGTYLIKWDSKDAAGNYAEQAVFSIVLQDLASPQIQMCNGVAESVEAASAWKLCTTTTATDNVDSTNIVTGTIRYTVQNLAYLNRQLATSVSLSAIKNVGAYKSRSLLPIGGAGAGDAYLKDWTRFVGKYLVTVRANDFAGIYGKADKNNVAYARKAIVVKDTRAPWINIFGAQPTMWECSNEASLHSKYMYVDNKAQATDLLDGVIGMSGIKTNLATKWGSAMNPSTRKVSTSFITYNTQDRAGNKATTATRRVQVRDTLKPTIKITGATQITYIAGSKFTDAGATAKDLCTGDLTNKITLKWNRPFPNQPHLTAPQLGTYIRTYSVTDASKNHNYVTRKFIVEDQTDPVLTVTGSNPDIVEASRDKEYTDAGATCKDFVDGSLSHAVEVSGDVVNMRVPATYKIKYDCQDLSGNNAGQLTRKVVVQDKTCPTIKVLGARLNYIEAGFPYVDAGATATDSLDGDITKLISTDGNTIDTAEVFYQRRSCQEIHALFPQANTGEYYITTYNAQAKAFARTLVWCHMDNSKAIDGGRGYTFYALNAKTAVVPFASRNAECESRGLEMLKKSALPARVLAVLKSKFAAVHPENTFFPTGANTKTDDLICSTNDQKVNYKDNGSKSKVTRAAEKGKYVINYHVSDRAGNAECKPYKRTVIVKDTISRVKILSRTQLNANFMAEQSESASVNGWVIGAVASAVTGLALLGFSSRKTVVTTVPV